MKYYRHHNYTAYEIIGFLLFRHHIVISVRSLYRILRRLRVRVRGNESCIERIIRAVQSLHANGFSECGYRSVWRILNSLGIRATQRTVMVIQQILDPEGVSLRSHSRLRRRQYNGKGPNGVIHIDGYDKLKPFGISIHGAICGFSRKILWLQACPSNKDPRQVADYFIHYLQELGRVPHIIRTDDGNENVIIRSVQVALRLHHQDSRAGYRSALRGRSVHNQRVEMMWSFLGRCFTRYWRNQFLDLLDEGFLDNTDPIQEQCIRYCFLPVIQRGLDMYKSYWNTHRLQGPVGIPDVMYYQPFLYGAQDCSHELPITQTQLQAVRDSECTPMPYRGCREEFLNLIDQIDGMNRFDVEIIETCEQAKMFYKTLVQLMAPY